MDEVLRMREAIGSGDIDKVKNLLELHPQWLTIGTHEGPEDHDFPVPLLHLAIEAGNLSLLQYFLERHPPVIYSLTENGETCLVAACHSGNVELVQYILEKEPSLIDVRDEEDMAPIHYACQAGHLEMLKQLTESNTHLLSQGVSHLSFSDSSSHICTDYPIHFACQSGNQDMVAWLLEHRALEHITKKGMGEDYPWDQSMEHGHTQVALHLIRVCRTYLTGDTLRWSFQLALDLHCHEVIEELIPIAESEKVISSLRWPLARYAVEYDIELYKRFYDIPMLWHPGAETSFLAGMLQAALYSGSDKVMKHILTTIPRTHMEATLKDLTKLTRSDPLLSLCTPLGTALLIGLHEGTEYLRAGRKAVKLNRPDVFEVVLLSDHTVALATLFGSRESVPAKLMRTAKRVMNFPFTREWTSLAACFLKATLSCKSSEAFYNIIEKIEPIFLIVETETAAMEEYLYQGNLQLVKKVIDQWEEKITAGVLTVPFSEYFERNCFKSPASVAALMGHTCVLEYLFSRLPPDLSLLQSLLTNACQHNHEDVARLVLAHAGENSLMNPNNLDSPSYPIDAACFFNWSIDTIELMLDSGAASQLTNQPYQGSVNIRFFHLRNVATPMCFAFYWIRVVLNN